jgi:hypothetical protein
VIFDADIDKSREVPDIFLRVDLNHLEHRLERLRNMGVVIDSAGGGVMADSMSRDSENSGYAHGVCGRGVILTSLQIRALFLPYKAEYLVILDISAAWQNP